jgi:predicted RNA-binding protein with PUA-like domain
MVDRFLAKTPPKLPNKLYGGASLAPDGRTPQSAATEQHPKPESLTMTRYWLMKTEPTSYSIEDLEREGTTFWDGIRNFQARNLIRDEISEGDDVLVYHSNANPPGVAGVARVVRAAYPDPSARDPESKYFDPRASDEDPRWYMVDVAFQRRFPSLIPLERLKSTTGLEKMVVNTKSRLSVQPVTPEEFAIVLELAEGESGP